MIILNTTMTVAIYSVFQFNIRTLLLLCITVILRSLLTAVFKILFAINPMDQVQKKGRSYNVRNQSSWYSLVIFGKIAPLLDGLYSETQVMRLRFYRFYP